MPAIGLVATFGQGRQGMAEARSTEAAWAERSGSRAAPAAMPPTVGALPPRKGGRPPVPRPPPRFLPV